MKTTRWIAIFLLIVLLIGLVPSQAGGNPVSYIFAINDEMPIEPTQMRDTPLYINGKAYVSDAFLRESSLKVYAEWQGTQHSLVIIGSDTILTIEWGGNIAYDSSGRRYETYLYRYDYENKMNFFVEVSLLCQVFGWKQTVTKISHGFSMVRILTDTNASPLAIYILAWDDVLKKYATPPVIPTPPPLPSESSQPNPPTNTPIPIVPTPPPEPIEVVPPLGIYLTFDGSVSPELTRLLDLLAERNMPATFFLSASSHPDAAILRRLTTAHPVGVLLNPDDESLDIQAQTFNNWLDSLTFHRTRLARLLPTQGTADADSLLTGGYQIWGWTYNADDQSAQEILSQLPADGMGTVILRFSLQGPWAQTLPDLLRALSSKEKFFIRSLDLLDLSGISPQ